MIQSDKTKWVNAMEKEMESLHTEVWELGSKWVFKTKKGANGTIERHKGRLVAEGYSQRYGQAPVSQRTVAWFEVASNGCQMDVTTAFLNGEEAQPEGYAVEGKTGAD